jgi:hypothetical protein
VLIFDENEIDDETRSTINIDLTPVSNKVKNSLKKKKEEKK